jgi:hypothetical protein
MTDRDRSHQFESDHHRQLPSEFAAFLRTQARACLLLGTDRGSSFVLKTNAPEIDGLRGPIPILLRHELYRHRSSPVIRLLLRFYDAPQAQPPSSLAFECFVNVDDEEQRSDYGELARQDLIPLHFYDDGLRHRLTKAVSNSLRPDIPQFLLTALRLRARIPRDQLDFDRAKAEVIARTSL